MAVTPLDNEAQWIALAANGRDAKAFGVLAKHYQQALRQYCRRLCKNQWADADDLAQDTLIKAFDKLASFRGEGSLQDWLFKIAYFEYLNKLRQQKPLQPFDEQSVSNTQDSPSSDGGMAGAEATRDLERAMTQLSTEQRACLTLHFAFGYSHSEISNQLEMPLGSVKSHITRAKTRLTELLQQKVRIAVDSVA
ncbi:RNA polymerase sigma factor [Paraferrimonas sedimenticola]|uniref:RNA polymerase sigma factor n=1 Tax=Paraferrimonas sedimenticola TaxID=375674 RepID=A0AA37RX39_9GAMM|nr:RNA polymerase sigma factor [Paraferrimonas sedimenticola]GLP97011.1 RNA polymerase sigma factor [Paraferrimonas sedimenticola]